MVELMFKGGVIMWPLLACDGDDAANQGIRKERWAWVEYNGGHKRRRPVPRVVDPCERHPGAGAAVVTPHPHMY